MAATKSFAPEPHREMRLNALVKGTATGCTRCRSIMWTAPANGVGIDGIGRESPMGLCLPHRHAELAATDLSQPRRTFPQHRLGRVREADAQALAPGLCIGHPL